MKYFYGSIEFVSILNIVYYQNLIYEWSVLRNVFLTYFLARLFFKTEEVLSPPARRRRRRLRCLRLRPVKF